MDLCKKYGAVKADDFIGFEKHNIFFNRPNLFVGPTGSGKTSFAKACLEKEGFLILNSHSLNTTSTFKKVFLSYIYNTNILNKLQSIKETHGLIVDDLETIILIDRSALLFLKTFLSKNPNIPPLIITCSSKSEKLFTDLKKYMNVVQLSYPNMKQMYAFLSNINEKENLNLSEDRIIREARNIRSIRNVLMNLDDASNNKQKLYDYNIYDLTNMFLSTYHDEQKLEQVAAGETTTLSLIVLENFPNMYKKISNQDVLSLSNMFCSSDIFDYNSFKVNNWDLLGISSFYKLFGINSILNKEYHNKRTNIQIKFSSILTKISHSVQMQKRIMYMSFIYDIPNSLKLLLAYISRISNIINKNTSKQLIRNHFQREDISFIYKWEDVIINLSLIHI